MPLPESQYLPREPPISPTVRKQVNAMLTGGTVAAIATLVFVYTESGKYLSNLEGLLVACLFLVITIIGAQVIRIRAYKKAYEDAVAAIYEHHPHSDDGIDVIQISNYSEVRGIGRGSSDSREVSMRAELRQGKVIFFVCIGDISNAFAIPREGTLSRGQQRFSGRVVTPNMFEIGPFTETKELRVFISSRDNSVRVVSIEYRNPHDFKQPSLPSSDPKRSRASERSLPPSRESS